MSIAFFKKHWFLVGLVLLVGGGLTVGLMIPGEVAEKLEKREGVGAIVASAPGSIGKNRPVSRKYSFNCLRRTPA